MPLLKLYHFRDIVKEFKAHDIEWFPAKGKGSHGSFKGHDKTGNLQSYPVPRHQQKEMRRRWVKAACERFGLDAHELFSD